MIEQDIKLLQQAVEILQDIEYKLCYCTLRHEQAVLEEHIRMVEALRDRKGRPLKFNDSKKIILI